MKRWICATGLVVTLFANGCTVVQPKREVFPKKPTVHDTSFPTERPSYMTTDLPKSREELRMLIGQTVLDAIHQYEEAMMARGELSHQPKKGLELAEPPTPD